MEKYQSKWPNIEMPKYQLDGTLQAPRENKTK